jgi:hypothetical protein
MKIPLKTLTGLGLGIMIGMTQTSCSNKHPVKNESQKSGIKNPEEGNNSTPDSASEYYCPPCGKG